MRDARRAAPAEGFQVALSCIRRVTTGSGRNRSTTETVLWQDERRVTGDRRRRAGGIRDPADAMPCDPTRAVRPRRSGGSTVSAEVPGVDYAATFEVPVFRTAASDQPRTDDGAGRGRGSPRCRPTTASPPAPGSR